MPIPTSNHDENDNLDTPIALRKGVRSCSQYSISNYISYRNLSPRYHSFVSQLSSIYIPYSVQNALTDSKWKDATIEEMIALHKNNTWELVKLPEGKKTWVASECI